jgi:hypothetical protein
MGMAAAVVVMAMFKVMVMDMAATTAVQATIGWPQCWAQPSLAA